MSWWSPHTSNSALVLSSIHDCNSWVKGLSKEEDANDDGLFAFGSVGVGGFEACFVSGVDPEGGVDANVEVDFASVDCGLLRFSMLDPFLFLSDRDRSRDFLSFFSFFSLWASFSFSLSFSLLDSLSLCVCEDSFSC